MLGESCDGRPKTIAVATLNFSIGRAFVPAGVISEPTAGSNVGLGDEIRHNLIDRTNSVRELCRDSCPEYFRTELETHWHGLAQGRLVEGGKALKSVLARNS